MCERACVRACVRACLRACVCVVVRLCVIVCVCVCVCVRVCACECVCVWCVGAYIYACMSVYFIAHYTSLGQEQQNSRRSKLIAKIHEHPRQSIITNPKRTEHAGSYRQDKLAEASNESHKIDDACKH